MLPLSLINFVNEIDGCTMGGPLSVTLSEIYMVKMEIEVFRPLKLFLQ